MIIEPRDLLIYGEDLSPLAYGLYPPRAACDLSDSLERCALIYAASDKAACGEYEPMLEDVKTECKGIIQMIDASPNEIPPKKLIGCAASILITACLDSDMKQPAGSMLHLLGILSLIVSEKIEATENE